MLLLIIVDKIKASASAVAGAAVDLAKIGVDAAKLTYTQLSSAPSEVKVHLMIS